MESPKTVRFSGCQFRLGVESLHDAAGEHPFGAVPVQQKCSMLPQHLRDALHRLESRAHDHRAPAVEKQPGIVWRLVFPEALEVLSRQPRFRGLQIHPQQVRHALDLLVGEVLRTLEISPSRILENVAMAFGLQRPVLGGPCFVDRLVQVSDDMKTVQYVDCRRRLRRDYLQVGLPHVAADVT